MEAKNNSGQWRTIAGFGIRVAWRSSWLRKNLSSWPGFPYFSWEPTYSSLSNLFRMLIQTSSPKTLGDFSWWHLSIRPEISNLTMFSQWSQSSEGLTRILENLFKQGGSTNGASGGKSRRQIMQSGIDFRVQDLEAVAAMTDEQLKQAYEILNSRMLEQLRTSFQRRRTKNSSRRAIFSSPCNALNKLLAIS